MDVQRGPCVVVGIDGALPGLAALRAAVTEAVRRDLPLYAVRVEALWPDSKIGQIDAVFAEALGGVPVGLDVHRALLPPPVAATLVDCADQPGDLLVIGTSGTGWWHTLWSGSIAHTCVRKARCPLLIVPAPPLARAVPQHRWIRTPHDVWRRFEQETTSARG